MADQRITQLTALPKAGVAATDVLPIADVSASETKKVTAKDLVDAGLDLVDASSIDLDKLDQSSVTKLGTTALADDAVTYAKIQNVSATDKLLGRSSAGAGSVEEIACTAAGRALLDDASASAQRTTLGLGTIATQNASSVAITGGTITGGTITGITDLAVADGGTGASTAAVARQNLGVEIGTNVQAYDAGLASIAGLTTAADQTIYTTAADTYQVTSLTAAGRALLDDADAAAQRTTLGLGAVATANTIADSLLADRAVTASKLADESTVDLVAALPASGAFIGQLALDTNDNKTYLWDGSQWVMFKASGSINTAIGSTSSIIDITITTTDDQITIAATPDDTANAAEFLAGPSGAAGAVSYRTIAGADLPTATTSAKGGVQVDGNGLTMSGDTIAIDNTVTANTSEVHVVQYDANGLVTSGRQIQAADLPLAGSGVAGAVYAGSGLTVSIDGEINHTNSVASGTYTKVTVDTEGHVTAGEALIASDIPDLSTDKLTTGFLPSDRIAVNAITGEKLANYAVSLFGETQPVADHIGQFFFNPITRDLFLWDGNVYQPVGISAGEIILAGTYDASTNLLDSVTAEGSAAGFTTGQALPAADTGNNRYYVVVSQTGTGTAPAPTVTLEPPDILLSNGSSYVLIETSETITAQIASNVGFTPYGTIASTNVQAAISELEDEKLPKLGGTMTGDILLDDCNIVFEGSTANDYETTLTVTDPTADRTVTFQDASGTVALTSDLNDGTY